MPRRARKASPAEEDAAVLAALLPAHHGSSAYELGLLLPARPHPAYGPGLDGEPRMDRPGERTGRALAALRLLEQRSLARCNRDDPRSGWRWHPA